MAEAILSAEEERRLLIEIAIAADDYLRFREDEDWEPHYADLLDSRLDELGPTRIDRWRNERQLEEDDDD